MATTPYVVTSLVTSPITLTDVRGYGATSVTIPSLAANLDLSLYASEVALAQSFHLKHLVDTGKIQVVATFETINLNANAMGITKDEVVSYALIFG